jgi:hypothetical protein
MNACLSGIYLGLDGAGSYRTGFTGLRSNDKPPGV